MDLMNGRRYVQPKHSGSKIDSSHFRIGRAGSAFLLNRPMKINPFQIRRAVLVLALSLSSCALVGGGRVSRRAPFEESEFAGYGSAGSATVSGKLVVTSSNGMVHLADDGNAEDRHDGTFITLLPVAAYTREMVDRELGDGEYLAPSDPRLHKYVRLTRTDAEGNFVFKQIPAGEYFVAGQVKGNSLDDFSYLWACECIKVGKGQPVKIKLSHNPQHGSSSVLVLWTLE
jgi:hypothetical protein